MKQDLPVSCPKIQASRLLAARKKTFCWQHSFPPGESFVERGQAGTNVKALCWAASAATSKTLSLAWSVLSNETQLKKQALINLIKIVLIIELG